MLKFKTFVCFLFLFTGAPAAATTLHISPAGNDAAAGTEAQPLATLAAALAKLDGTTEPARIIVHEGIYPGRQDITSADAAPTPLVIEGDGDAIFDGSITVSDAEPVDGMPHVYATTLSAFYTSQRIDPQMWEADTRVRYLYTADERGVASQRASFYFDDEAQRLYLRTSDDQPPAAHDIAVEHTGVHTRGDFRVRRPNITLRNLRFRHGVAVAVAADHFTAEACDTFNGLRAFIISPGVKDARISRCTARDVANGVMTHGDNTIVEHCTFLRPLDRFTLPLHTQDNSAVQFYHPASNGTARGNVGVGFNLGIFMKGVKGNFTVANNTLIGPGPQQVMSYGIFRVDGWEEGDVCTNNIIADFWQNIPPGERIKGAVTHDGNRLWNAANDEGMAAVLARFEGKNNRVADPRFVAPWAGDYRLAPDSDAADAGALPRIGADDADTHAPHLALRAADPAQQVGASWIVPASPAAVRVIAEDRHTGVAQMRMRTDSGDWSAPMPFTDTVRAAFTGSSPAMTLDVAVADGAGNWSAPQTMALYLSDQGPALIGEPMVRASARGMVVQFTTTVPCLATLHWGADDTCGNIVNTPNDIERSYDSNSGKLLLISDTARPRTQHCLGVNADVRTLHYRLEMEDALGQKVMTPVRTIALTGEARTWHVSPNGSDNPSGGGGSAAEPWATLQFAVDRALPGDRIVLADGIYLGKTQVNRGGVADAPLVIEAANAGRATLETAKDPSVNAVILLEQTPHVTLRGLEMRWFYRWAIFGYRADGLRVERCKFWNQHFVKGRRAGIGVFAVDTEGLDIHHNLFVSMDSAFDLLRTSQYRITHNTVVRMNHRCAFFIASSPGIVHNNSFTFTGNYHYLLSLTAEQFAGFDSDYNNLAQYVHASYYEKESPNAEEKAELMVSPGGDERIFPQGNKGIVSIHGFAKETVPFLLRWQRVYGKDTHSIMAQPHYVDPLSHDFRLQPDSPNLGAGKDGATLGAFGQVSP